MKVVSPPSLETPSAHSIEALRGLAALMVVVTHYEVLVRPVDPTGLAAAGGPGMWGLAATGVDLFFVLSGFVFARLLATSGWSVLAHGVRRFFRLYPLYLVALVLYAALRPAEGRWEAFAAHVAMLHTTGSLQTASAYNAAFWSLPPELEFYILLPALALLVTVLARRGWTALWPLLACAGLMKLALVAMAHAGEPPESLRSVLTVHVPGLLIEFLLGTGVAVWGGHVQAPSLGPPFTPGLRRWAGALGLMALLGLVVLYSQHLSIPAQAATAPLWFQGVVGLWAASGFAALMLWLLPAPPAAAPSALQHQRAAWWPLADWAGRLSYGLYLFHNAAPQLLERAWPGLSGWPLLWASLALTVLMAAVLHLAVEAPARRYGRLLSSRLQGPRFA